MKVTFTALLFTALSWVQYGTAATYEPSPEVKAAFDMVQAKTELDRAVKEFIKKGPEKVSQKFRSVYFGTCNKP
jgi:hypothetical protein